MPDALIGKPVTVLELFETINKITENNKQPKILNEAKNEIKDQYLSTNKVRKFFNWSPKYTLEDGIRESVEWYKEYLK